MARFLFYLCFFALALSTPSRADSVSCIIFANYHVPYESYKIVHHTDRDDCCRLCADDGRCVAWTWETNKRCALKDDAQYLVAAQGVDSGIKYRGFGTPHLTDDGVGATVLFVKADTPKTVSHQPVRRRGSVARASVSVSSTGGRARARVTADDSGVTSASSVSGSGHVETSASNPSVSLATSLSSEEGKKSASVAVTYYKKPVIVGEVVTIKGGKIPIISSEDGIYCYTCSQYPCLYTKGVSYKKNGKVIKDFTAASRDECCRACRASHKCVSWWYSARKRCVLNSNIPGKSSIDTHVGGLFV